MTGSSACDLSGATVCRRSREERVTGSYVARVIQLAFLAPDIVQKIQRAEHPLELNAQGLLRVVPLPLAWDEQRSLLGITG
jgi:hypothetical protein